MTILESDSNPLAVLLDLIDEVAVVTPLDKYPEPEELKPAAYKTSGEELLLNYQIDCHKEPGIQARIKILSSVDIDEDPDGKTYFSGVQQLKVRARPKDMLQRDC